MNWSLYFERWRLTLIEYWPRLLAVVVILLILRWLVRLASLATRRVLGRVELAVEIEDLIARSVRILVIIAGFIIILLVMGWGQLALSFVAGLGISGLVIGFALQDITKNFAAGLLLLFQRPFRIGDRIAIAGEEGIVQELALRATTIRTDDGREVFIPNATIYTGNIANLTRYTYRRYMLPLKLKGTTPLPEAIPLLEAALRQSKPVQSQPAAEVLITNVASDPIEVTARFWLPARDIDAQLVLSQIAQHLRAVASERGWLV